MVFLDGEVISVDSQELRIARMWAGNWKTHRYPLHEISNLRTGRPWWGGGLLYWIRFDYQGKSVWAEPTREEPEHLTMLDSLREYVIDKKEAYRGASEGHPSLPPVSPRP